MMMSTANKELTRGSDTGSRQEDVIVPDVLRSGLRPNPAMGSATSLTASGVVMLVIAGNDARTCTAGVRAAHAPARGM